MNADHEFRSLIATQPTLKWFSVIGIIIMILGLIVQGFLHPLIGLLFLLAGFIISALSIISLLYLWLSDRLLPHPK
ncbi:MAG: hypothetical protein ACFFB2_03650 [Promethearchaeota archaeon]